MNNLTLRSISSFIGILLVISVLTIVPPIIITGLLTIFTVLCLFELWQMTSYQKSKRIWIRIGGSLYILFGCFVLFGFIDDRYGLNIGHYHLPQWFLLWLLIIVWSTDIGAYVAGRLLKGPKLAPQISPNKTWSGFFGGILSGIMSSSLFMYFNNGAFLFCLKSVTIYLEPFNVKTYLVIVAVTAMISIVAQLGDLLESWVKRKVNVKDSGKMMPGHGGILDRVDSLLAVAVFYGLIKIFDFYFLLCIGHKCHPASW